jgi:hypothetical protein
MRAVSSPTRLPQNRSSSSAATVHTSQFSTLDSSSSVIVNYTVLYDYTRLGMRSQSDAYSTLSSDLKQSVADGNFTATLQFYGNALNIVSLFSVQCAKIVVGGPVVVNTNNLNTPTVNPTSTANLASGLLVGEMVGIVVALLLVFAGCGVGLYYYHCMLKKKRQYVGSTLSWNASMEDRWEEKVGQTQKSTVGSKAQRKQSVEDFNFNVYDQEDIESPKKAASKQSFEEVESNARSAIEKRKRNIQQLLNRTKSKRSKERQSENDDKEMVDFSFRAGSDVSGMPRDSGSTIGSLSQSIMSSIATTTTTGGGGTREQRGRSWWASRTS